MLNESKADHIEAVIAEHWPESIAPAQIGDPALADQIRAAREGMRMRVDIDNGEVWFETNADRRDRTKARQERARTGVS